MDSRSAEMCGCKKEIYMITCDKIQNKVTEAEVTNGKRKRENLMRLLQGKKKRERGIKKRQSTRLNMWEKQVDPRMRGELSP